MRTFKQPNIFQISVKFGRVGYVQIKVAKIYFFSQQKIVNLVCDPRLFLVFSTRRVPAYSFVLI